MCISLLKQISRENKHRLSRFIIQAVSEFDRLSLKEARKLAKKAIEEMSFKKRETKVVGEKSDEKVLD